jgi:phosphoribosylformimino-5-aminoimidazole carboxamide ribotide isomerase
MGGAVVRAVGGRRAEYRALVSRITDSTDPLHVANAFRHHYKLSTVYLADLDAISGATPDFNTIRTLHDAGFHLWVDAGVRRRADAVALAECGVDGVIVGLETVESFSEWDAIAAKLPGRVIFSLDLRGGLPFGDAARGECDAATIAERVIAAGVRRMIVLDLLRVGTGHGPGTEALVGELRAKHPQIEFIAGGGVRNDADLARLERIGVAAVLAASSLHDQTILQASRGE